MSDFHFHEEVLEHSYAQPVVVDYWAPWCGPCRTLGPVIESVASEAEGAWKLVKVNIDDYPDLAAQEKVRGIPAVKMYHRGEKIGEFMGSLPKNEILQWLNQNLPNERTNEFLEIRIKLETNYSVGLLELGDFVEQNPDMLEAHLLLAKEIVLEDGERAAKLVEEIRIGHDLFDDAEDIRIVSKLMTVSLEEKFPVVGRLLSARKFAEGNDLGTALQFLLEAVRMDKSYQNDLPRRATIAFFHLLGKDHELTKKYRREFDMALY